MLWGCAVEICILLGWIPTIACLTDVNFGRADKAEATYESYQEPIGDGLLIVYVKAMFSATQRCNIVATLFRMVTTLFQRCSAVLR